MYVRTVYRYVCSYVLYLRKFVHFLIFFVRTVFGTFSLISERFQKGHTISTENYRKITAKSYVVTVIRIVTNLIKLNS